MRAVERPAHPIEHFVDLAFGDEQRWADRHGVACDGPRDHALLLSEIDRAQRNGAFGIESTLALLVGDQFDAADQTHSARLPHQRMFAELAQARLEVWSLG